MAYINFSSADICTLGALGYVAGQTPGANLSTGSIIRAANVGAVDVNGTPLYSIYMEDGQTYVVLSNSTGVQTLKANTDFLVVTGSSFFQLVGTTWVNMPGSEFVFNRGKIISVVESTESQINGSLFSQVQIEDVYGSIYMYLAGAVASSITTPPVPVTYGNITYIFYIEDTTEIWKYLTVNFTTGVVSGPTNLGLDSNVWSPNIPTIYGQVQNSGILAYFESAAPEAVGFFINTEGNIVSSVGPTDTSLLPFLFFDQGTIGWVDYNIAGPTATGVVTIFDGTNIREFTFPDLILPLDFYGSLFSNFGDTPNISTKDYTIAVVAPEISGPQTYLLKPSGSVVSITSEYDVFAGDLLVRGSFGSTYAIVKFDGTYYNEVKFYNQDGAFLSSQDISGFELDLFDDVGTYGADGNIFVGLYNATDLGVISYNNATSTSRVDILPYGGNSWDYVYVPRSVSENGPAGQNVSFTGNNLCVVVYNTTGAGTLVGFNVFDAFTILCLLADGEAFQVDLMDNASGGTLEIDDWPNSLAANAPSVFYFDPGLGAPEVILGVFDPNGYSEATVDLVSAYSASYTTELIGGLLVKAMTNAAATSYEWYIFSGPNLILNTTTDASVQIYTALATIAVIDTTTVGNSFLYGESVGLIALPPIAVGETWEGQDSKTYGNYSGLTDSKILLIVKTAAGDPTGFYTFDNDAGLGGLITNLSSDNQDYFVELGETTFFYAATNTGDWYLFTYDWATGNPICNTTTASATNSGYSVVGDRVTWDSGIDAAGDVFMLTLQGVRTFNNTPYASNNPGSNPLPVSNNL